MNKNFISVTPDSGGNCSLSVTAQANTTPNTRNTSVVISGSGITKPYPFLNRVNHFQKF